MRVVFVGFCLITSVLFISCSKDAKTEAKNISKDDSLIVEKSVHPMDSVNSKFDTLLIGNLRVKIYELTLDSFVKQTELQKEKVRAYDYRDFSRRIEIIKDGKVLVDTLFVKESFAPLLVDENFLKVAVFKSYSFENYDVQKGEITFFGLLTKPETDWTIAYYHKLNLSNLSFEVERLIDEPI